ncbi:hypothetical protein MNBD_GAMMA23-1008 [hydrothermal vent metagenome]|uniref:Uncharacterized protein n=1 Tax=hydrothermal vent metagenome TaxID=652676 RepID=A0A3B0ZPP5_9ZZZZ
MIMSIQLDSRPRLRWGLALSKNEEIKTEQMTLQNKIKRRSILGY